MSKIVKTYTLRQLNELQWKFLDEYPCRGNSNEAFLTWLQDCEDRAKECTDKYFRKVS